MYHLYKATRIYNGIPYCGPTSHNKPAIYETIEEAQAASREFLKNNPVGWNIYEAESGKLIDGFDYHQELGS